MDSTAIKKAAILAAFFIVPESLNKLSENCEFRQGFEQPEVFALQIIGPEYRFDFTSVIDVELVLFRDRDVAEDLAAQLLGKFF